MNIVDMNVKNYLEQLKSSSPVPGGGSVAGIDAVQGISLTIMVLNLTLGKEKYMEYEEENQKIYDQCEKLFSQLIMAADSDKEAFLKLSEAYKLPRNTDEEADARKAAISEFSIGAIEAPFELMKLSLEGLELTSKLVGKSNKMASSDLGVAALNLIAAIKSAWLNVKINLPNIEDEMQRDKYKIEGKAIMKQGKELAHDIYKDVKKSL